MGLFDSIAKILPSAAIIKGAGGLLGGSPKQTPIQINQAPFNLDPEAQAAKKQADAELARQQAAAGVAGGAQQALIKQLQAQSTGQAPSLAEAQLKAASSRNLAQQLAAAAAQRGGNVALQQRNLTQAQGASGQQLAENASQARLAEQLQSQGLLAQTAGQASGQANQLAQQYINMGYDFATATKKAQQQLALSQAGLNQQANAANAATSGKILGGLLNAAGGVGGMLIGGPVGAAAGSQLGTLATGGGSTPAGSQLTMSKGGRVPGHAKDAGDSTENDTVPAMLSPGEVVVPRTAATSPEKAKSFVQELQKRDAASTWPMDNAEGKLGAERAKRGPRVTKPANEAAPKRASVEVFAKDLQNAGQVKHNHAADKANYLAILDAQMALHERLNKLEKAKK